MNLPFDTPEFQQRINRRAFLGRAGLGLGGLALANLMKPELAHAASAVAGSGSHGKQTAAIMGRFFVLKAEDLK